MKKYKLITGTIVVALFLCGCNNTVSSGNADNEQTFATKTEIVDNSTSLTENNDDVQETNPQTENEDLENNFFYDVYEPDSPDSEFNDAINKNGIDKAYEQEISLVSTVGEMVGVECKYIEIWQKELENSATKYAAALSDADKEAFEISQAAFNEYINTTFAFESDIILQNKYDIHLGNTSYWLLRVAHREAIRERTIHLKYLHYLLERASNSNEEYTSLTFDTSVR